MDAHAGTYQVYGLAAPGDLGIEYVGRTSRGLVQRANEHIQHARRRTTTKVARWVKGLLDRGTKPVPVLIASCPSPQAAELVEEAVIRHLRPPANSTMSGEPEGNHSHAPRRRGPLTDGDRVWASQAEAAAGLGVNNSTVSQHVRGELKTVAGKVLRYLDDDARACGVLEAA